MQVTRNKSKPHWKPKYAPLNVIHPAIKKLNKFEATLLAAVIPFQRIVTLPSTMQKGLKGHVVCVPSDAHKLERVLPNDYRPHVMYAGKLLRKVSHRHAYKSGFIRADCLLAAIEALLETPVYQNFHFDPAKPRQLQADFPAPTNPCVEDEVEGEDAVEAEGNESEDAVEADSNEGERPADDSHEVEENQGRAPDTDTCIFENNVHQILDNFSRYHDDATTEMQVEELTTEGIRVLQAEEIRVAPAEGNTHVPCWQDEDLKAKMFPQVFGGYFEENPDGLTKHQLNQQQILHVDRRFGRSTELLFHMLRDEQTRTVFSAALLSMQKGKVATKEITVANATNAEFIKGAILQKEGVLHLENLRTSPDYMKSMRRDFLAFLRGCGTPTFFLLLHVQTPSGSNYCKLCIIKSTAGTQPMKSWTVWLSNRSANSSAVTQYWLPSIIILGWRVCFSTSSIIRMCSGMSQIGHT
jgi:hypothetical protein